MTETKPKLRMLVVTLATAATGMTYACAPGPVPISSSARDPSSPSAPEGIAPMTLAATASPVAPSGPANDGSGHEHHHGQAPASADAGAPTVYVCPMHPEVTSSQPGSRCPKCNMNLVPKK